MFNDLHRAMQRNQSALSQQLTILTATLVCLVFTSVCGIQHFQRAGHKRMNLFQAVYFVVVVIVSPSLISLQYNNDVMDWQAHYYCIPSILLFLLCPTPSRTLLDETFSQLVIDGLVNHLMNFTYSGFFV